MAGVETKVYAGCGRTNCDYFGYLGLPATADAAIDINAARVWNIVEEGLRRYR